MARFDGIRIEEVPLTLRRYAAKEGIADELIATAELLEWRNDMLSMMVYELSVAVQTQVLAPEVIDMSFTKRAPVSVPAYYTMRAPVSRLDHLLLALPRYLRWRQPRYHAVQAHTRPHECMASVTVHESVHIERELGYPDSTVPLPSDRFGRPVYIERIVLP